MAKQYRPTIYVDESGDLGFGEGGSSHFLIAAVTVRNRESVARPRPDTCKRFGLKRADELHAHALLDATRRYALSRLAAQQVDIRAIIATKNRLRTLRESDNFVWNYLAAQLLSRHIVGLNNPMIYVDARSVATSAPNEFPDYPRMKTRERAFENGEGNVRFDLEYKDSKRSPGIQMADLCAYAFNRRYAHNDSADHDIIVDRIVVEWPFE